MAPRKRDENTYWWNESPITDEHEALDVLRKDFGGAADPIYLSLEGPKPEICQELHRQGDGGRASSCHIEYLEIHPDMAKHLVDENLVTPIQIRHMGYTETVREKLTLSRKGAALLDVLYREKMELAKSLPIAGTHSKFSGIFNVDGSGRENGRRGGKLYFDLKTPLDEKVRVFPDTKDVERIEPEKV